MVKMLRELAEEGLSGRLIAYRINPAFGTFLTPDAVRRRAAALGIKLKGRGGGQKGNRNARASSNLRPRDPRTGVFLPSYQEAAE